MNTATTVRALPPFTGYTYGYPHKTAYRPLTPARSLRELWSTEDRSALFLYAHVPFCEMRCGFCNLFTLVRPKETMATAFLAAFERQCEAVSNALDGATFARMAVGGGTPTLLEASELERLFLLLHKHFRATPAALPCSVETSPETAQLDRLTVLRSQGVTRVSIGVQSFVESECASVARPQRTALVHMALERLRSLEFPVLNIDLMYGLPEQTTSQWLFSVNEALRYRPEELYLYPLYVRPVTRLSRREQSWDDERLERLREARALLESEGYEQVSLRMFKRKAAVTPAGPPYRCQQDGMVGLGCGARSYTTALHYSSEWAVGARGVREILERWVERTHEDFSVAEYGIELNEDEQRRRTAILSLLSEGIEHAWWKERFGAQLYEALPELRALLDEGLAHDDGTRLSLTADGMERSDALGPWLYSPRVRSLMEGFALR